MLALIFLVVQAALMFYARSVALQTAREGVSQLRLNGQSEAICLKQQDASAKSAESFSRGIASGTLHDAKVDAECQWDQGRVQVRVNGTAISLIGFTLHVTEQAEGRIECFQTYSQDKPPSPDTAGSCPQPQNGGG